ncbi:hypothetical protein A0128_20465 [Leptospira tipperaryensis]|uniref:Uncharacterized protein n=1 Tax=Leptospira tipperaryensis TaxID=2564040 RepID=A0A1D7V3H7_9LEPT|nr:hypothetical protein A0128_20465 [Leptospira tipperaryensis]
MIVYGILLLLDIDRVAARSAASSAIIRERVAFGFDRLEFINTDYEALYFKNANGADIYLYPGFAVIKELKRDEFGIIDLRDIVIEHRALHFLEQEYLPKDSPIVDKTWTYVNKNGSPDRRFKENPEIPILLYHEIYLRSKSGLNEAFSFSNPEVGKKFCESLSNYLSVIGKLNWSLDDKVN